MVQRSRIYFTSEQKSEIWDRWQRGESMSSIGRSFDRGSSSIYPLLSHTGGIRPPVRNLFITLSQICKKKVSEMFLEIIIVS